jgi:hypothetical protein
MLRSLVGRGLVEEGLHILLEAAARHLPRLDIGKVLPTHLHLGRVEYRVDLGDGTAVVAETGRDSGSVGGEHLARKFLRKRLLEAVLVTLTGSVLCRQTQALGLSRHQLPVEVELILEELHNPVDQLIGIRRKSLKGIDAELLQVPPRAVLGDQLQKVEHQRTPLVLLEQMLHHDAGHITNPLAAANIAGLEGQDERILHHLLVPRCENRIQTTLDRRLVCTLDQEHAEGHTRVIDTVCRVDIATLGTDRSRVHVVERHLLFFRHNSLCSNFLVQFFYLLGTLTVRLTSLESP